MEHPSKGHKVADETLVQLTLNELPPSYEDIIQSLTVLDILPTLATISSKLLNKSHRLELHRNRLGEDKALTAQFAKARLYCNKCSIQKEENTVNIVINEHQEAFSAAEDIKIALTEFTKELDKRQHWCLDSGATRHVTGNKNFPETYEPGNHGNVTTVGGEKHVIEDTGIATLCTVEGKIKLKEVLYVPSLRKNLISRGCLAESGKIVAFSNKQCWIMSQNNKLTMADHRDRRNGLYRINILLAQSEHTSDTSDTTVLSSCPKLINLWHHRFGHLNFNILSYLSRHNKVLGVPTLNSLKIVCEQCLAGKQHRERFPKKSDTRTSRILQLLYVDLGGPMPTPSACRSRYCFLVTNVYSRRTLKQQVENETGLRIGSLRTDRGGEFMPQQFQQFCEEHGIKRIAERQNKTIFEKARNMLAACNLPGHLWCEVINKKPNVSFLKTFGCIDFVHVLKMQRAKLESKTKKCVLTGFDEQIKAYRLFESQSQKNIDF
uniref:GAG-pre-integrase domain-containing protein n=1 Tax=Physcomitrium patens TaxID=3218 RepID=A0A7I4A1E0_PHYPA